MPKNCNTLSRKILPPAAVTLLLTAFALSVHSQTITNLQQLTQTLNLQQRAYRDVRLEATVCASSRPKVGVLIVRDDSGVELLEVGDFQHEILPGEKIRLQGGHCLLRKRDIGIALSVAPTVDNDGVHAGQTSEGFATLKAGQNPIRLESLTYFLRDLNLEVRGFTSNWLQQSIDSSNLWHAVTDESGHTDFLPGLYAECFEGYWETMPDFDLLRPVKTGIATDFESVYQTRLFGVRYTGYFYAPAGGRYGFRTRSDYGCLLFLDKPELPVIPAGVTNAPMAVRGYYGEAMSSLSERRWMTIGGQVGFVSKNEEGLDFELRSDSDVISVRVVDAAELDPLRLRNSQVKVTGVGRGVLTADQRIVLGRMCVVDSKAIALVENVLGGQPPLPISSVGQVQSLPLEMARRALPVHIRGVVTDAKNSIHLHRMSIQDGTRGIYVSLESLTNLINLTNLHPAAGEVWEVEGHSDAGDFAPVIIADKMTLLADGRLPEPARPTWTELLNGSMDVQWAELQGLVASVQSSNITLLLPEGRLEVLMDGHYESDLMLFEKTVVRIRGVLYAVWDKTTREVRVGNVMMRNATISVDASVPTDPFDAVVKTPRELLLFDTQASAYRRVKVRGQIVYADATQLYLERDGTGLRLIPAEKTNLRPGDLVEAVGYADVSGPSPLLNEAVVRKTGSANLPKARILVVSNLIQEGLDSTLVSVAAKLTGLHSQNGLNVLELQSNGRLFIARLRRDPYMQVSWRVGSTLRLTGVYVEDRTSPRAGNQLKSFELLLNSPADIVVLSQPSWWTLQRLVAVVGLFLVILALAAAWIIQLRRQVEQRTVQLHHEIRERERAERQQAIESERSRIAHDLHDDLGSSLTEIGVLANSGHRAYADGRISQRLFSIIAGKARASIAALDVIVWAVNPEDNTLQSLADYLSGYVGDYLSNSGVVCRFKVPVALPEVLLDGQVRHSLFLGVKETLNNIVRHACAGEVEFGIKAAENVLEIFIMDNGTGFDPKLAKPGNGLKNLRSRLSKLGGSCVVESQIGVGTTVTFQIPLPSAETSATSLDYDTTFD